MVLNTKIVKPFIKQDELAEGGAKVVTVNGKEVAVFKHQGRLLAIQNRCPHEGASLVGGVTEGSEVICPSHGYRFDLLSGSCSTDSALRARIFKLVPQGEGFLVEQAAEETDQSATPIQQVRTK